MSTKKVVLDGKDLSALIGRMSPEQSRAARGWFGWSQQDLAGKAGVGLSTVKSFENGSRTPIANNLVAIQRALEGAGVEFMDDASGRPTGIRIKAKKAEK